MEAVAEDRESRCETSPAPYTTGDVLAILNVTPTTLWRWVRSERFPGPVRRIGPKTAYWDRAGVDAFMRGKDSGQ